MPRSDNNNQYRYGPHDYRTQEEDYRRNQADRNQQYFQDLGNLYNHHNKINKASNSVNSTPSTPKTQNVSNTDDVTNEKKWSTGWAIIGFFIGIGLAANQIPNADEATVGIMCIGGVTGYIAGRFYKAIFVFAFILFILWIVSET